MNNTIKKATGKFLVLVLIFAVVLGMSSLSFAALPDNAGSQNQSEDQIADQADDQSAVPESGSQSDQDSGVSDDDGSAADDRSDQDPSAVQEESSADQQEEAASEESADDTASKVKKAGTIKKLPDDSADENTAGDFIVKGDEENYTFDEEKNTLFIKGDVKVMTTKKTTQSIVVENSCKVTLAGVDIDSAQGPGILIKAPYDVELILAENSENTVRGADGTHINATSGDYAGIEPQYVFGEGTMASLTISGSGSLAAIGHENAAGIGGSNSASSDNIGYGLYGNITIKGGNITAKSPNGGAGIGSSNNPKGGTSSGSFKATLDENGNPVTWGTITIEGGTVFAQSEGSGAGIGGGNHVDSGKIVINGGAIEARGGNGAGIGAGRGSSNYGGDADKGHGYYYAEVEINGGSIKAYGGWLSAGIGGGYECDAIIKITGGTIEEAIGGNGNTGSYYQGGPGIGGGYQGNVQFTMTGGTIKYAKGGWSAPGIGYGAGIQPYGAKRKADGETVSCANSFIDISGGTIEMAEGGLYAAGIGSGNGGLECHIRISGGDITAKGYASSEDEMMGGAGIGSGIGAGSNLKYKADTETDINITGGNIVAVGGWGAAGIGSGAMNKMADVVNIKSASAGGATIEAYADGTKFAIDTRDLGSDNRTTSHTEGRDIEGNILQGTFVHKYQSLDGVEQGTEGLKSIKVICDMDESDVVELTGMKTFELTGYRSFATSVKNEGNYNVFTDDAAVADGNGRYFNKCIDDVRTQQDVETEGDIEERNVKYKVTGNSLCDNFYLFPVKAVVVTKVVDAPEGMMNGITGDLYFSIKPYVKDPNGGKIEGEFEKRDGKQWIESIHLEKGVPQEKAFFINVDEASYDVWEVDENGEPLDIESGPVNFGDAGVKIIDIKTKHGEGDDNNAIIDANNWTDKVYVINTFDKALDIKLKKVLPEYFEFKNGNKAVEKENATVVFRVTVPDPENEGEYIYDDHLSFIFNEAGTQSDTITIFGAGKAKTIIVEEVYTAGYKVRDGARKVIDLDEVDRTKPVEVEFENYFDKDDPDVTDKSGVINLYENKKYKDKKN